MSSALTPSAGASVVSADLQEIRRLARWGMIVVFAAVLPIGAWVAFAPLSSAVVAPGYVKVDLNRRPVQHLEGGTVREVLVRDGQQVVQGQPLLVLEDVTVDADRNRLGIRVMTERASLARLEAEQVMAPTISFPTELTAAANADPRLAEQFLRERQLFETRREALLGQTRLLAAQRNKVMEEIAALRAQISQATEAHGHQRQDLEMQRKLLREGFISANRVTQLEGGVADYGVKIEEKRSDLARAQQRVVDTDLRMRALEGDYRQQASDQRKATSARLSEIEQELRKSLDASTRQVIRAPAAGSVIDLKYTAPGAVVTPREVIADVVPVETRLLTEARIKPEDVTRIMVGQESEIRFTAFAYRTTRLVQGRVVYLSPDRLLDRATNLAYYSVLVEADPASLREAGDLKLQAGMPAEVYIKGPERTPLEYLLEPITQVVRHAGRER